MKALGLNPGEQVGFVNPFSPSKQDFKGGKDILYSLYICKPIFKHIESVQPVKTLEISSQLNCCLGGDRHDQRGGQQRTRLLPGLLQDRIEVPSG